MSDTDLSHAELTEMFGGQAGAIQTDADELEVSLALQSIRAQLIEAAEKSDVGISQLARRLHIAPSAVSRYLGGENDMKVSTAVLYARALGYRFESTLALDHSCVPHGNHQGRMEISIGVNSAGTLTSGSTHIVNVVNPASGAQARIMPQVKIHESA
jgi:transcriptional regulator with XRE-family HTH domain